MHLQEKKIFILWKVARWSKHLNAVWLLGMKGRNWNRNEKIN